MSTHAKHIHHAFKNKRKRYHPRRWTAEREIETFFPGLGLVSALQIENYNKTTHVVTTGKVPTLGDIIDPEDTAFRDKDRNPFVEPEDEKLYDDRNPAKEPWPTIEDIEPKPTDEVLATYNDRDPDRIPQGSVYDGAGETGDTNGDVTSGGSGDGDSGKGSSNTGDHDHQDKGTDSGLTDLEGNPIDLEANGLSETPPSWLGGGKKPKPKA